MYIYLFTLTGNMKALEQRTHYFLAQHLTQVPCPPILLRATLGSLLPPAHTVRVCTTGTNLEIMSQSLYRTAGASVPSPPWKTEGPYLLALDLIKPSLCRKVKIYMNKTPGGSDGKESACNTGDPGLIPGLGRSPGEGNGNPIQ